MTTLSIVFPLSNHEQGCFAQGLEGLGSLDGIKHFRTQGIFKVTKIGAPYVVGRTRLRQGVCGHFGH